MRIFGFAGGAYSQKHVEKSIKKLPEYSCLCSIFAHYI